MSTSVLEALPGKLDIKRHSPCILYLEDGNINTYLDMSSSVPHRKVDLGMFLECMVPSMLKYQRKIIKLTRAKIY